MAETQDDLTSTIRRAMEQLPHLPRALRLVHEAAGRWTTAWVVLLIVQGLLPVGIVIITRRLVDSIVDASGTGWAAFEAPVLLGLAMAALLLAGEVAGALTRWVRTAQAELVGDHIRTLIQARAAEVDMALYDSPAYFDTLHRARFDAQTRPAALVEGLGTFLQGALTLAAMAVVLATYAWWLPLALLISTLPAFLVILGHIARRHRWSVRTTTDQRRALYYEHLQSGREVIPEVRLYGLAGYFRTLFSALRARLRGERIELARAEARAGIAAGFIGLGLAGASLLWMVTDSIRGTITLGQLAMYGQAFLQGQKLLRSTLTNVGQIYLNLLFLGNLFEFLETTPTITDPPEPRQLPGRLSKGIAFRDVAFTYPTADTPALENFTLEIPAGSTVALVGPNGAGKTTLFKLLLRFYDPHSGSVEIDGIDLRDLALTDIRRRMAVLFQTPLEFSATVFENVAYGKIETEGDPAAIGRALDAAGARPIVDRLPDGDATMLGPWFGGTELSPGEWQRIALSRAFLRDADILLLDEPTSAMDSWAEARWLEDFRRLTRGKTTIVITHRLTTARHADVVHVVDDRRIVESGRPGDLVAGDGPFAAAWRHQVGPPFGGR